ncbi:MAG: biotin--[acetyl-CoA-carboxylase] ligase [Deltaproteobacteria bacterium]|nr:MAG: biotin--[acetyl-CoA-carboxylase] ligase [Deltaproteobacteria bacterium]
MHHVHLESTDSTQTYLKQNLEALRTIEQNVLVSTSKQMAGYGRSDNEWEFLENALAFSFTLEPNEELTLTSLEIGVLLTKFFKSYDNLELLLKWPNDLLSPEQAKVGGILCTYKDPKTILVGVGINVGKMSIDKNKFPYPVASLSEDLILKEEDYMEMPRAIYDYILANRIRKNALKEQWDKVCIHLHQKVRIVDGANETKGIFRGIDHDGSALLDVDGKMTKVITGSLFMN